jgi:hypothetical protein
MDEDSKKPAVGFHTMEPEKLKEVTTMGRVRFGEIKQMQRDAQRILKAKPCAEAKEVMDYLIGAGHNATYSEAIVLVQAHKAVVKGDTKAAEFIRDTSGNKPNEKIDINADIKVHRFEQKIIEMVEDEAIDVDYEESLDNDEWKY